MASISSVGGLQAEIATRLNEVSATEADTYLNWINFTSQDIATRYPMARWLETSSNATISAGTRAYSLPSNFVAMYSVWDETNGFKLTYVTKQEYDALMISGQQEVPRRYTINEEDIEFSPIPNNSITYRYEYRQSLSDVSAASATLPIPKRFLEAYVFKGMQLGLERRGDYSNAKLFESRYLEKVEQMIKELKSTEMKRIKSVREFKPRGTSDPIKNAIWNA